MSKSLAESFPQVSQLKVPTVRLGLVARIFSGGTPEKSKPTFWESGDIPWIASGAVNQEVVTQPTAFITPQAVLESSTKNMPAGSLIIALAGQGKTKATVAQMGIDAYGNQSLACIAKFQGSSRFLFWWLHALYREIRGLSSQETRDGLNLSLVGQLPVPLFDSATQNAIAHFLDRETARIDQLIEKKAEFIHLLEEKRRAVITAAIVGRIGPGHCQSTRTYEQQPKTFWYDSLPTGWESRRIKTISTVMRGASPRPIDDPIYFDDLGEFAWVRISDVSASNGVLRSTTQRLSELGAARSVKIRPGDLFLSIAGSVGKPCIAGIKACIHDGFVYFPHLPEQSRRFLYWIFESRSCFAGLGKLGTQLNLNTEIVGNIEIPFPSLEMQNEVGRYLDFTEERHRKLTQKTEMSIRLLNELRSALITAAVTGQIDVTTWHRRGHAARHLQDLAHLGSTPDA